MALHRSWFSKVAAGLAIATGALGSVAYSSASAQLLTSIAAEAGREAGRTTTLAVHGNWTVRCETASERICRISTVATAATPGGSGVTVELTGEGVASAAPLFYFRTPLDLLVADGAELRLGDGQRLKLAFRSCHVTGCLVPFRLSRALEDAFRRGSAFTLRLADITGKPIDVEVSLAGFSAAANALARR